MKLRPAEKNYIAYAFVLPLVCLFTLRLISTLTFNGTYSMLYSDTYHQYYPFFLAYRKALLSGDSLLYSWNVGLGMDYVGLISYYLASPLNLLSVILPERWMLGYFSLLMPLKLSFASLFFAIMLKKLYGKNDFSLCLFGLFYSFCAWALGYQWNIMWLDTFALLPLVMLGMVRLLDEQKFLLYVVVLFLAIASNYYIGFFVCLFVFLSFFCYEICRWRSWRRFFTDLLVIGICSVLAIGMTAFLTLPTYAALKTTQSNINQFPTGFRLNIASSNTWKGLLSAMMQVAGNMNGGTELTFKEGLPNIHCGTIMNVLAILFLFSREIKLRDKICSVFLLLFFNVSFILRQLDFIWHGFHFTNMIPYRFSFLYSFVVLLMAYNAWIRRDQLRSWQIVASGCLSVLLVFCSKNANSFIQLLKGNGMILSWRVPGNAAINLQTICTDSLYVIYNILFIIAYVVVLLYAQARRKKEISKEESGHDFAERKRISSYILWSIMSVEIIMILVNFGCSFPGTNVSNYPLEAKDTAAVIRYMNNQESENLFFRAEATHSQTLNDGALNGYNGISTFTSSANVKVTQFMKALGYAAKETYNRYCYEESSPVGDLFLNLKYQIERYGPSKENAYFNEVFQSGYVRLLENNAYLPLGFLTNAQIVNVDFSSKANPFLFQNTLMSAATGNKADCWYIQAGNSLTIVGTDLTLNSQSQTGYCTYKTESTGGTIAYRYTADRTGLFCFNLDQIQRNNFSVYLNGSDIAIYSESYSLPQMLSVCNVVPGDVVEIRFRCSTNQTGTIDVVAAILDEEIFRDCYDILNRSTLTLTEFSNTGITGTINCDRDGVLYTSIPQNGNWSVKVDGKNVPVILIGNVMVGLNLSEGPHMVEFEYRNQSFRLGLCVSAACAVVLLAAYLVIYQPSFKRKKGKYER